MRGWEDEDRHRKEHIGERDEDDDEQHNMVVMRGINEQKRWEELQTVMCTTTDADWSNTPKPSLIPVLNVFYSAGWISTGFFAGPPCQITSAGKELLDEKRHSKFLTGQSAFKQVSFQVCQDRAYPKAQTSRAISTFCLPVSHAFPLRLQPRSSPS